MSYLIDLLLLLCNAKNCKNKRTKLLSSGKSHSIQVHNILKNIHSNSVKKWRLTRFIMPKPLAHGLFYSLSSNIIRNKYRLEAHLATSSSDLGLLLMHSFPSCSYSWL